MSLSYCFLVGFPSICYFHHYWLLTEYIRRLGR
nr:MAG TPA: hypothetical protein [Caudoviricetes sp.]